MTHSEMDELYELYLLGALDAEEMAVIDEHLSRHCEYCVEHIRSASELLISIASTTELAAPPVQLRERVLALAKPAKRKVFSWPIAFALASAASLALLIWGVSERGALQQTAAQLQDVSRQRNELRAAIEVMTEADIRAVKFGQAQDAPHGQVFVSRNGGVVFLGSRLPQLASGRTFELWLIPGKGNPRSAGLFTTNAQGISVNVLAQAINPAEFAAIAVSIEPEGGSPQPTTKPILVIPVA